jgi:NAD(P)H-quinone oxidoreductase subunit L
MPMGAGGLEPPQPCGLRILSPLRLPIPPCPRPGILDFARPRFSSVALPGFLSQLSSDTLLVLAAYITLAGLYLVVIPLALLWWLQKRWNVMGKIERTAIYGLVFLFFPGMILFAPFLNLRMAGQGEVRG